MSLKSNSGDLKIQVPGKGSWVLTQNDHIVTGGEGSVYISKGYAFKILLDQSTAASSAFQGRIGLLKNLKSSHIISPLDFVYDEKGNTLGYYMEAFSGEPLVRSFPTPWRKRNSFEDSDALNLCQDMWEANQAAHSAGAVIVDGNDTNYLFQPKSRLALIDVDSWQIGGFKATAIKDSVRDFSVDRFDENTDWFSWGIVSFQVFTGIHPYQGTHPSFKPGQMVERMKAKASVFDTGVSLSKAVRDFSCIPLDLRNWYEEVFQKGHRSQPPKPGAQAVSATSPKAFKVHSSTTSGSLRQTLVKRFGEEVLSITECGVVITRDAAKTLHAYHLATNNAVTRVQVAPEHLEKILKGRGVFVENRGLWSVTISGSEIRTIRAYRDGEPREVVASTLSSYPVEVQSLFTIGGSIFGAVAGQPSGLQEFSQSANGGLYTRFSWPVNANSSKFFQNIIVSDLLGMPFLIELHEGFCSTKAECLRRYDVIDAMSPKGPTEENRRKVVVLATDKVTGQNFRLVLSKEGLPEFSLVERTPVDYSSFNIAVLNKGISVDLSEDRRIKIYDNVGTLRAQANSDSLESNMTLYSVESKVYYTVDDQVYQLGFN